MISGLEAADRFVKNSIILHIKVFRARHERQEKGKRKKEKLLIRHHKLVETQKLCYDIISLISCNSYL